MNDEISSQTSTTEEALWARKVRLLAELNRYPFEPPWWIRGKHRQTIIPRFFRKRPAIHYRKERWDTPDDDFLSIYRLDGDPANPTAVVLHGLEGRAEASYILGLNEEFQKIRWNVVNLIFRSCDGELNRAKRMYHSGETSDLAFVVAKLIEGNPKIRLYIAGFSLGANVTAKWLGENGDSVPAQVHGAAAVSAPFDLNVSSPHVEAQLGGLYVKRFLRTLIPKAIEKEKQYPGCVDIEKVKASKSFADFDTYATAALHGYRDAEDYYTRVSCGQFLPHVRRPLMLLSSEDDPFNPGKTVPHETIDASPWLIPQFAKRGGHVGFMYGPFPGRMRYWAEEQIARFFKACDKDGQKWPQ